MLALWAALLASLLLLLLKAIYNICFHPLRHYPGPRLAAATRLWYTFNVFRGHHKYAMKRAHDDYGLIVRIAPNELSYIDPRAWEDIYGNAAHEKSGLEKEPEFFSTAFSPEADSLVDSSSREFKPQKKNATKAFSQGSLIRRGHIMSVYVDRSIKLLREHLSLNEKSSDLVDINPWLGNMVLDIHSKLTMSQDFSAVDRGPSQHRIVSGMHQAVTVIQYCTQLQYLPRVLTSLPGLLPRRDVFTVIGNVPPLGPAITARLAREKAKSLEGGSDPEEDDFVSHMLESNTTASPSTIRKNCLIFILSAVETLPGYICSVLYYLLQDPSYYDQASKEIRSAFRSTDEIDVGSAQSLEFLRACMREVLRVSPPAVGTLPRRVPKDGAVICGQHVPGDTTVGIHNWSITHSGTFWKHPEEFKPERWLQAGEFATDQRQVFKPFGVVPRVCVAQHLVLLESTLIVAKLLHEFDMTMDTSTCGEWPVHKGHFVPTRGSLFIGMRSRSKAVA